MPRPATEVTTLQAACAQHRLLEHVDQRHHAPAPAYLGLKAAQVARLGCGLDRRELDRSSGPIGDLQPVRRGQRVVQRRELGVHLLTQRVDERRGVQRLGQFPIVLVPAFLEVGRQVLVRVTPALRTDHPDLLAAQPFAQLPERAHLVGHAHGAAAAALVDLVHQRLPVPAQTRVSGDMFTGRVVRQVSRRGVPADQFQGPDHRPVRGVAGPELEHLEQPDQPAPIVVGVLALIKTDPGNVSLESMLTEIDKLLAVRAVGVPAAVFADVAPRVLAGWRAQVAVESPSHLRAHPNPAKTLTLLAALLHIREREITDTLVELLIATVHRINARAEKKVTAELINAFKKVTDKENILFSIAEASLAAPEEKVRRVVYPAIAGGEATLRELVHEYRTKGPVYRTTVSTTLRASYTNHYRRGLIRLLEVLQFRSSNATHRPVIGALELVSRYAAAGNLSYYPAGEHVPAHPGLRGDWEPLVHKVDKRGRRRTVRMAYEVCTFRELRERLRCKEIWVVGAERWRNPDEDLPADFEERRHEHYRELSKPLDAAAFVDPLREEMRAELAALHDALPAADWLQVADRSAGAIKLAPIEAAPEPRNLRRLKAEVGRRWGMVPLIDMLKEAVLRTGSLKRGHLGRRPRHDQPGGPGRAVDAGDLRLRH